MTAPFLDLVDLASERLGAAVVSANDEFFEREFFGGQITGCHKTRIEGQIWFKTKRHPVRQDSRAIQQGNWIAGRLITEPGPRHEPGGRLGRGA